MKYVENGWKKGLNTHYIKKCDESQKFFVILQILVSVVMIGTKFARKDTIVRKK